MIQVYQPKLQGRILPPRLKRPVPKAKSLRSTSSGSRVPAPPIQRIPTPSVQPPPVQKIPAWKTEAKAILRRRLANVSEDALAKVVPVGSAKTTWKPPLPPTEPPASLMRFSPHVRAQMQQRREWVKSRGGKWSRSPSRSRSPSYDPFDSRGEKGYEYIGDDERDKMLKSMRLCMKHDENHDEENEENDDEEYHGYSVMQEYHDEDEDQHGEVDSDNAIVAWATGEVLEG